MGWILIGMILLRQMSVGLKNQVKMLRAHKYSFRGIIFNKSWLIRVEKRYSTFVETKNHPLSVSPLFFLKKDPSCYRKKSYLFNFIFGSIRFHFQNIIQRCVHRTIHTTATVHSMKKHCCLLLSNQCLYGIIKGMKPTHLNSQLNLRTKMCQTSLSRCKGFSTGIRIIPEQWPKSILQMTVKSICQNSHRSWTVKRGSNNCDVAFSLPATDIISSRYQSNLIIYLTKISKESEGIESTKQFNVFFQKQKSQHG